MSCRNEPAPPNSRPGDAQPCASTTNQCPCPVLEIVDRRTGNVVSGTTVTRIVGQKVLLEVRARPAAGLSNIRWTVGGLTVKDYTQSVATGTKTNLAAPDLQNATLDFYWIQGGSATVTVAATAQGCSLSASVSFTVLAPTAVSHTSVTGAVAVSNPGFPGAGLELHYGISGTPGINWTCRATAPAGGDGQIAVTQLIRPARSRTRNDNTVETFGSAGAFILDDALGIQYDGTEPITAGAAGTTSKNDSPGTPLTADLKVKSADDQFHQYFMYRPNGADSIWVTLSRLNWNWQGSTSRTGANWGAPTGVGDTPNPSGAASVELPEWSNHFTALSWH